MKKEKILVNNSIHLSLKEIIIVFLFLIEDSRCSSEESIPHSISNGFGSSNDENNKHESGRLRKNEFLLNNLKYSSRWTTSSFNQ